MKATPLYLILLSVLCSAVAQLLLKKGMSQTSMQVALQNYQFDLSLLRVFLDPWVFSGLTLYAVGAVVWLGALAQVDVSFAYPFVGLGFILVMVFGYLFFNESIGLTRVLGTLLVVSGIYLISRS